MLLALALLASARLLRADIVEPFGGEPISGKVDLEFGGGVLRMPQGQVLKLDFTNIRRIRFERAGAEECVPGVVLRDGTRLASPHVRAASAPLSAAMRASSRR